MAIVTKSFTEKIHALALVSEDDITKYEIYGDLTFKRSSFRIFESFSQVAELFQALDLIQTEIRKNDYAILQNQELKQDLRKVLVTFKAIIPDTGPEIYKKIKAVEAHLFAYLPVGPCSKQEPPLILKGELAGYEIDMGFIQLTEDLSSDEYSIPCARTYQFFYRFVIYAFSKSSIENRVLEVFNRKLTSVLITLFTRNQFRDEDTAFLNKVFGEFLFYRLYRRFDQHLERRLDELLISIKLKSPDEKFKAIKSFIEMSKNAETYKKQSGEKFLKEPFSRDSITFDCLVSLWDDIPVLCQNPEHFNILKDLFSLAMTKKLLKDPFVGVYLRFSENDFLAYIQLLSEEVEDPTLYLVKFPGLTRKVITAFHEKFPNLKIVGIDDKSENFQTHTESFIVAKGHV